MLSKVKRVIAMILVLGVVLSLAGCKKEEEVDPNADPLTLLEQPELIQMINDLNSDLEKQIAHSHISFFKEDLCSHLRTIIWRSEC